MTDHDSTNQPTNREIMEELMQLRKLITGNGDPSKGMYVRLDRQEQRMKMVMWIGGGLYTTSLAVVGAILVNVLT